MSQAINDALYQQIIETWRKTHSIRKTASLLSTNQIRVQRVLITEGLWSSQTSAAVEDLHNRGLSVGEIAEELCMTPVNVQNYLPYSKGIYNREHKTDNARRIALYRERKAGAYQNQVIRKDRRQNAKGSSIMRKDETNEWNEKADSRVHPDNRPDILELHCELWNREDNCPAVDSLQEKNRPLFRKLAKADRNISRTILVPGDINLHALHYVLNACFGWQNSHLHEFTLSEMDYDTLTQNRKLKSYENLCGLLFRFPVSEEESVDLYWDDDYRRRKSFRSWLREKYTGPYSDNAITDTWYWNNREVRDFHTRMRKYFPDGIKKNITLNELQEKVVMDDDMRALIESIRVQDFFAGSEPVDEEAWQKQTSLSLRRVKSWYHNLASDLPPVSDGIPQMIQTLQEVRTLWSDIDDDLAYCSEEEVQAGFRQRTNTVCQEAKSFDRNLSRLLVPYLVDQNPRLTPRFQELYYRYDFGDDWVVRITCTGTWQSNDVEDVGDPSLQESLATVLTENRPVCIASDGLRLIDDVGGIYGYLAFLKTINGISEDENEADDPEDVEGEEKDSDMQSTLKWASSTFGWTGRRISPKNLL